MFYNGAKRHHKKENIGIMTEQKRFTLRMDGELFKQIEKRASENKRSVAKEIEYLLEQHIQAESKENDNK